MKNRREWAAKYEPKRASRYAERRAAGLCIGSLTCADPPVHCSRCERHLAAVRGWNRKANKRRYQDRKAAGVCVSPGCMGLQTETCVKCEPCQEYQRLSRRKAARRVRRERRRWSKKKLRAGLCCQCGAEPLASKRYGETCLIKIRARSRARWLRLHPGAKSRERKAVMDLRIEDFMHAGGGNLAAAQELAR